MRQKPAQCFEETYYNGQKILKTDHFSCLSIPLWRPRSQTNIKKTGHASKCSTLIVSYSSNKSIPNLAKNFGKRTQTTKNIRNCAFFTSFSTPACRPRSQSKRKTPGYAKICHTLIILCNSNKSHSLHCSYTWGKGHKRQKILIIDYFS